MPETAPRRSSSPLQLQGTWNDEPWLASVAGRYVSLPGATRSLDLSQDIVRWLWRLRELIAVRALARPNGNAQLSTAGRSYGGEKQPERQPLESHWAVHA